MAPHHDLLVEPATPPLIAGEDPDEVRDVPTWRCPRRPDRLAIGESSPLEPIGPHRRWWLGRPRDEIVPLTPPLGRARVLGRGRVIDAVAPTGDPQATDLTIRWEGETLVSRIRIMWYGSVLRLSADQQHQDDPLGARSCC